MGLSSTGSSNEGFQLCVFDMRRGQQEGQEIDKILFFYPPSVPLTSQLSVIGLSEGLVTFTRIFSPEAPCEVIEADKHSYIFYQPEPDIWMVLVIEKVKETDESCRPEALRSILKESHSLFRTFYGSIRPLLEKQPSGANARSYLHALLSDYLSDFIVGKKIQIPSVRETLAERGTIKMLSMKRETALEVQSVVRLLESSLMGNFIRHSMILFNDLLVSTTISPDDTANLFTYASLRLTPPAIASGNTSRSYVKRATLAVPDFVTSGVTAISPDETQLMGDTSYGAQDQRFHILRPLQRDRWWKEKDGFLVTDLWGSDMSGRGFINPTVWLHEREECMNMCLHQQKNLTVIILIPSAPLGSVVHDIPSLKQLFLENAGLRISKLEEKLTREWGGVNATHVAGYRYLYCDRDRKLSKASPSGKITTLTKCSLATLSKLRAEVDMIKKRAENEKSTAGNDLEVCLRAKNNAWVVCHINGEHELYLVLERASETLLYASDAVEKFSKRYCNGVFASD